MLRVVCHNKVGNVFISVFGNMYVLRSVDIRIGNWMFGHFLANWIWLIAISKHDRFTYVIVSSSSWCLRDETPQHFTALWGFYFSIINSHLETSTAGRLAYINQGTLVFFFGHLLKSPPAVVLKYAQYKHNLSCNNNARTTFVGLWSNRQTDTERDRQTDRWGTAHFTL